MTNTEQRLQQLDDVTKQSLRALFGSVQNFYDCIYLVTKAEHLLHEEKPENWERKLESARHYRRLVDERVTSLCGISGDTLADIRSDYFEDYANFRERTPALAQDEFLAILQKIVK